MTESLPQITGPNVHSLLAWSPDGRHIAFRYGEFPDSYDIYLVRADGTGLTNLTNHPARYTFLTWSPDGQFFDFKAYRDGRPDIYIVRPDGSMFNNLTNDTASEPHLVMGASFPLSWEP